jgi:hypothetical protein
MMRQELDAELRRLYEEVYGDEFIFGWHAIWTQFKEQIREWKHGFFAGAKASLSRSQLEPKEQFVAAANQRPFHAEGDTPLRGEKPVVAAASPVRPKRHTIFPGAAAVRNSDLAPKSWDESQWID